jgi:acyl-CoA reductase-like NAD-dependent aldehyde dehydrogenase
VQNGAHNDFLALVTKLLKEKKVGDPNLDDSFVGPLITQKETDYTSKFGFLETIK